MGTGQAKVKQYARQLRNLIHRDKISPGPIVSRDFSIDETPGRLPAFDDRGDGWTKVLLRP